MAREEEGQGAIALPGIPNLPPLPASPQTGLVRGASLSFIKDCFYNPDGSRKAYHAAANGITGDGKSTLIETLIEALNDGCPSIVYLVNPKHIVSEPEWSYAPICTTIDNALEALESLNELMQSRITDPNFDKATAPNVYFVIDEIDWICSVYGKKAVNLLRNLFKVGRSVKCFVFLAGQTAQLGTGFTSDDYRQMVRFVMGSEALAFLNNPQFSWDSEPYRETVETWQSQGRRFALIIPTKGKPFLQLMPHIEREIPNPLIPAPSLKQEEDIQEKTNVPDGQQILIKLIEQSRKHGWISASKAKAVCWNLRGFSTNQIREIFEEVTADGQGYLRGSGDGLEWRIDRVTD
ncbi:MAG: AAA family ATPase [Chroococcales cyanobacterium]